MSAMQAYLAAKYMSGPKADAILAKTTSSKKKKRKAAGSASASSSMIKDDDVSGWGAVTQEPDEDEAADAVVAADRGFKKRQKRDEGSGWATVREPTPPPPEDEQPQVVEETPFKGGLLTSAQLKKTLPKKTSHKAEMTQEEIEAAQETIYRDSSGRKVDIAAERAEAARRKREREEKEAAKMEWGKGLVQRDEAEQRKKEHEAMRAAPFARTKDDAAMNEAMKAEERWNDPAAAFLSVRRWVFDNVLSLNGLLGNRKSGRKVLENLSILVHRPRQIGLVSNQATDGTALVSRVSTYPRPSY